MQASSPSTRPVSGADLASCSATLRGGSRSFFAASLLLPRSLLGPATALYAFCRLADDAVDTAACGEQAVEMLHRRLELIYRGCPLPIAADRAFAETVARYHIPFALPVALLDGFAWDAGARRYEELGDLEAYAARVAGAVGAMMAILMGVRGTDAIARACDLGVAMQLTNIARDVGEDAAAGRLYLPLRWMREAGLDAEQWLARPVFSDALAAVVRRLLDAAETHYTRAQSGIAQLPLRCRPGIAAARLLYAEIGSEVARSGCDSVTCRAVVPAARKATLVLRSFALAARPGPIVVHPPLAATRFLVEAVASAPEPLTPYRQPLWERFDERVAWVVELFARLDQRAAAERARV